MCSIIFSFIPSSRSSSGVDCERSKSSARRSSQQSFGLCPSASEISVNSVRRRASSSTARSVQCAPIYDAPAEKRHLFELQEDLSRGMEALSLLRLRRGARETGVAVAPLHAAE